MTPIKIFKISLLLLWSTLQLQAYNYIYVQDPQFWEQDQGTIEEAQFTIHPRGIYMEVGMYLTLSGKGTYFENDKRNVEIIMGFDLPENSIVIDSWLWINEDIIQADILDRWTASNIYEDIVGRRQDPSLLTKNGDNQYELRVFPMQSDSTRRVKITYLVPGDWKNGEVSIPLPTGLLQSSANPPTKVSVQSFLNNDFKNPSIAQLGRTEFETAIHATLGAHLVAEIPSTEIYNDLDFVLEAPTKNGVFLSRYEGEEENFYQLAVMPSTLFDLEKEHPKKVAILVDYEFNSPPFSKSALLETLEKELILNLEASDSFNIFLSQTNIDAVHPTWMPADSESIRNIFDDIDETNLSNFSNLPDLLTKGIDYIKAQGTGGSLLVLSNATQVGEPEIANLLISDLREDLQGHKIPIHVADYDHTEQGGFWINGIYYRGNEYFYTNITRITSGRLTSIKNEASLVSTINKSINSLEVLQGILDLHTSLEEGFCYGRYDLQASRTFNGINQPVLQVGKYQGTFPFEIEASGVINEIFFGENISIPASDVAIGNEIDAIIWAGNHIHQLEKEPYSNETNSEIVEWSLANRVLSFFTAFLALEVAQGGVVCNNCIDETDPEIVIAGGDGNTMGTTETDISIPQRDDVAVDQDIDGIPEGVPVDPIDPSAGPTGPVGGAGGAENDGGIISATNNIALDTLISIEARPNAFHTSTTITVQLTNDLTLDQVQFTIYDLQGRGIQTFQTTANTTNEYQFEWDATTNQGQAVSQGMYFFTVHTPLGNKHLKLIYLK